MTILPKITSIAQNFIAEEQYKKFYNYIVGKELTGFSLLRDASNFIYPFLGLNANYALNRVLTTETSFLFVPFTGFIPLHTCVENFIMSNDVDWTPKDIDEVEQPQITTYRGENYYIAPPVGQVSYKRTVRINGQYYRDNTVVWKALTIKLPDMINALWATLSMLPVQVPAFYFSKSMGRFIGQPDFISKFKIKKEDSEIKIMLLSNIDFSIDTSTEVITINIELTESSKTSYTSEVQYPNVSDNGLKLLDLIGKLWL